MSKDSEHKHEHEHEHEHEEEERALMAQLMQQQVAEIEEQVAQIDAKSLSCRQSLTA
jgi:hypothetical protein